MGNKNAQGRLSARRAAAFLAALGVLVMSSGIALMVAATPANAAAAPRVTFCHSTGSEGNPWVKITSSANAFYEGHVLAQHTSDIYPAVTFTKGQQTITVDAQGDQSILENGCQEPGSPQEPQLDATASVTVTDPSCENGNTPDYEISGSHVTWVVDSEDLTPNGHVTVTFTAVDGHAFDDESTTTTISKDFGPAQTCPEGPRLLTPQEPSFTDPTCTTDPSVTLPSAPVLSRAAAGSLPDSVDVNGIRYTATGDLTAGGTVTVDATLLDPETTTFGEAVHSWSHTFTTPTGCTQVSPPTTEGQVVVNTPKTKTTKTKSTVTPTVVEAGLVSTSAQDLRGEQGLALMVAGMVMLVAAGGLGLRVRGAAARI